MNRWHSHKPILPIKEFVLSPRVLSSLYNATLNPVFARDPNLANLRSDPRFMEFMAKQELQWESFQKGS
jgi:hypothetical protein